MRELQTAKDSCLLGSPCNLSQEAQVEGILEETFEKDL